jgi:DNA invertase Pin-like site-specific DNA recombinase
VIPAYALYRRSRSHQDLSIEEQRDEIRAWASANGYRVIREFADSGSGLDTDRRREFQQLLAICSSGRREADVVLCYDVSRFSRLEADEAAFFEFSLRRAGVKVIYTHEPGANEDGLTGALVKSLKRSMANDYSRKLSQVVQRGLRKYAALGHWTGGRPPYGYRRAVRERDGTLRVLEPGRWKARGEHVVLVVDAVEAAVVEEIFTACVAGVGSARIAHRLNERDVPPPVSDRRRGAGVWLKGTIRELLLNPIYTGKLTYGKAVYSEIGKKRGKRIRPASEHVVVDNAVPAIISAERWEAAQATRRSRKFGTGRPWGRPYLLGTMITCGHCGRRWQARRQVRGRVPAHYLCSGYSAAGSRVCDGLRVPTSFLDRAVIEGVQRRISQVVDRDALRRRLAELLRDDRTEDVVPSLEARLTATRAKIDRLVDALADGTDIPAVRARLVDLERERNRLEHELARARRVATATTQHVDAAADAMVEAVGRFGEVLEAGQPDERKAVVKAFLAGITIQKDAKLAILRWFRLPRVGVSLKVVELRGFEPLTPRLPALCSPS